MDRDFAQIEATGPMSAFAYDDTTREIATLTDDEGNTYVRAIDPVMRASRPFHTEMWYAAHVAGGALTATATFSGPTISFFLAYADEYAGATALDQTSTAVGLTGLVVDSGSRMVTRDGELIFGHGESFALNAIGEWIAMMATFR
ncbi:MAG TPA: hypothetical protein VF403_06340 [Kofleriaceae bacterium]